MSDFHKKQEHIRNDIAIQRGKVLFGIEEDPRGITAIIVPWFDIHGYTLESITKVMERINMTPRLRQDSQCETLIKGSLGNMDTRITIQRGNLVALDQEAATMLWQMKLPISKDRHYIPIR